MLEAEISPTGTVLVEGHHVGELQGFRFTADQSAGGEDGKALKTAAQKALAAEFETRAERFSASANGDIALGSDGTLRWIGAPIGTLVAGEEALKPRVILLADEQLTGPARDKVFARAERFVNFQVESLLKPLTDLKNADQIAGIGRGIAFQLVENFGLISRRDIAEDVKSLDQAGRAALRRLGVRFGAYHIFVPALIKPAPAGLITLLWALKNEGKEKAGFGDVVNALATGRTSVVIDPAYDRAFYKLAGFRPLGRRAVRVDILERLADLIRPALSWKAGLGTRPDGAYDGSAFIVTPPMMSILGANADDIEEILKGLGYRAEPKPAVEVKARLEAIDLAVREAAVAAQAQAEAEKAAEAEAAVLASDAPSVDSAEVGVAPEDTTGVAETAEVLPEVEAQPAADVQAPAAASDNAPVAMPIEAPVWAPKVDGAVDQASLEPALAEPAGAAQDGTIVAPKAEDRVGDAVAESADARAFPVPEGRDEGAATGEEGGAPPSVMPAEEPKPILLWRQGRFERPRHRPDQRNRGGQRPPGAAADVVRQPGERPVQEGRPQEGRRDRHEGAGRPAGAGKPKFDRDRYRGPPKPQGEGANADFRQGKPQGDGGRPDRREGRGQDGKGDRSQKPAFQAKPREERPVQVDPLSPFAKLAALRDQLKK